MIRRGRPADSALDADCRTREVARLCISDGDFMSDGGSVPFTLTM